MRSLRVGLRPCIRILLVDKHMIESCHLLDVEIAFLSAVAGRYRYEVFLANIGERIFLIDEITILDALIPDDTARAEVDTTGSIAQFPNELAVLIHCTLLHAFVPILQFALPDLEYFDWLVPHFYITVR